MKKPDKFLSITFLVLMGIVVLVTMIQVTSTDGPRVKEEQTKINVYDK
jgi:hypothetical protein